MDRILSGASLVSFDGRLTEAAIRLAVEARRQGVPVLVEAERVRPQLEQLLPLADYVVTSAHFPEVGNFAECCLSISHIWCLVTLIGFDLHLILFDRAVHVTWLHRLSAVNQQST